MPVNTRSRLRGSKLNERSKSPSFSQSKLTDIKKTKKQQTKEFAIDDCEEKPTDKKKQVDLTKYKKVKTGVYNSVRSPDEAINGENSPRT